MKSKWHIPLSSKDPGYQTELARCMFYNKRWDELTDEEKSDKNVPSIFIQRYSKVTKATIGDIAEVIGGNHGGGRKKTGIYGDIPFPAVSMEYKKAMAACRFFKKTWENLTDEERRWDPTLKGTLHHNNNQMIGLPVRSGDTTGKDGCFIGPDGIIDGGKPKIDGMVFDSRLQKVKKNCEDLCWVTDLITTLVKSQRERVDITRTMAKELHDLNNGIVSLVTLENSIKSNTEAIDNLAITLGDMISTLEEHLSDDIKTDEEYTNDGVMVKPSNYYNYVIVSGVVEGKQYKATRTTSPPPEKFDRLQYYEQNDDLKTVEDIEKRADDLWKYHELHKQIFQR